MGLPDYTFTPIINISSTCPRLPFHSLKVFSSMLFCSSIDLVNGRNPHTGKAIKIAAMKVTKFKAGANLKKTVNK